MGVLLVLIVLAVFTGATYAGFFAVPKGPNRPLYRSSLVLTSVSVYLMWAVTYLSQMNPIIVPERTYYGD